MKQKQQAGVAIGFFSFLVGSFCVFSVGGNAEELTKLPRSLRANGSETVSAIRTGLGDSLKASTVAILDDDKVVALGTILGSDGLIVTKASELGWQTSVRLPSGKEVIPEAVEVDPGNDIALLHLNQEMVGFSRNDHESISSRGTFLVSPATSRMKTKIGIVGANGRSVERVGGALGVLLGRESLSAGGVRIETVYEDTAAEQAGIKDGDIISGVNDTVVILRSEVIESIAKHNPGDNVVVKLKRGDEKIELNVVLGYRTTYFNFHDRNQRLSGKTSPRRSGFERVIQHDIPVDVDSLGGPLVDLRGNLVGVNIARADRVTTYAIPLSLLNEILDGLGIGLSGGEGE